MSSLIQFLAPFIPQSSPAGRVRRWPAPLGRRTERTIRAIVSLAAVLAALLLFATATHAQVTTRVGAVAVGWYAMGDSPSDNHHGSFGSTVRRAPSMVAFACGNPNACPGPLRSARPVSPLTKWMTSAIFRYHPVGQ